MLESEDWFSLASVTELVSLDWIAIWEGLGGSEEGSSEFCTPSSALKEAGDMGYDASPFLPQPKGGIFTAPFRAVLREPIC